MSTEIDLSSIEHKFRDDPEWRDKCAACGERIGDDYCPVMFFQGGKGLALHTTCFQKLSAQSNTGFAA